jgi:hypothetical protein
MIINAGISKVFKSQRVTCVIPELAVLEHVEVFWLQRSLAAQLTSSTRLAWNRKTRRELCNECEEAGMNC